MQTIGIINQPHVKYDLGMHTSIQESLTSEDVLLHSLNTRPTVRCEMCQSVALIAAFNYSNGEL